MRQSSPQSRRVLCLQGQLKQSWRCELTPKYIALQNDEKGNGPLKQYFIGETMHGSGAGIL